MNKPLKAQRAKQAKPPLKPAIVKTPIGKASGVKTDRHFVTALARGLEVLACFRHGDRMLGNQNSANAAVWPNPRCRDSPIRLPSLGIWSTSTTAPSTVSARPR